MIQDSVNKVIYEGNGQATEFFYPFEITKNTDVKVMTVSLDGVETVLTNDYFVDVEKSIVLYPGWADGESPPNADDYLPLADGWKLVIYRDVPYTQEVGMFEQYPFNVLEGMIDKTTILAQQLKDEAQRSMRLGVAVDNTDISMVVPHGQGTSFRWSDDGKRLEVTEDPAEVKRAVEQMASTVAEQTRTATESANTAVDSATSAKVSETNAKTSETNAKLSEMNAAASETVARECEANALAYKESALASMTKASASETASYKNSLTASTSANTATQAATTATNAANTATTKATESYQSAISAKESADRAQEAADGVATGQIQADWEETDTMSKAYIRNAPRFVVVSTRVRGDDEPTYGLQ